MTHEAGMTVRGGSWLAGISPGTWRVLEATSDVSFTARHFLVSRVRGRFRSFEATIEIGTRPGEASVVGEVDARSVDTGDSARDDHLRSSDFLDVQRWPKLKLSGQLARCDERGFLAICDMTIRDVTHPVEFDVHVHTPGTAPDGSAILRLSATGRVNRKDFGLRWNATIETGGVVVADQVDLQLELEAMRAS